MPNELKLHDKLNNATQWVQKLYQRRPKIGLVLGSGLGSYVDQVSDKTIIPYRDIPFFKETSVEGHEGRLILGKVDNTDLAILQGRLHAYEGHSMDDIVFPIRTLATLGIETLILTNASGGINLNFCPGDLVLIEDHINLTGRNPLIGPNIAELGPRFPDMTRTYDPGLIRLFQECASELNYNIKTGIYCSLLGPTYETPAEIRMLRILGADMVGMSTVPEVIAAKHLGLKIVGLSCVTNLAAGLNHKQLDHADIKHEGEKAMNLFSDLLCKATKRIGQQLNKT